MRFWMQKKSLKRLDNFLVSLTCPQSSAPICWDIYALHIITIKPSLFYPPPTLRMSTDGLITFLIYLFCGREILTIYLYFLLCYGETRFQTRFLFTHNKYVWTAPIIHFPPLIPTYLNTRTSRGISYWYDTQVGKAHRDWSFSFKYYSMWFFK